MNSFESAFWYLPSITIAMNIKLLCILSVERLSFELELT